MNEEINEFNINDIENVVDFKGHPLVSIIVSIKNTDYLLHACLESIMYQTYPNLEIILIDNMSLDSSFAVCRKFEDKDSRIKLFRNYFETESDLKTFGIKYATGDYITFMNGSDFISLNYIQYHLELMEKYNASITECAFIKVPERVSAENSFTPPKQNNERVLTFLPWQAIENLHSISHNTCLKTVVLWNKLFKKELFDKVKFPVKKSFEDEFTTYKLFRKSKIIVSSNQILYAYVQVGSSKQKRLYDEHRLYILEAYENYLKFFKQMNCPYMLERAGKRYLRMMLIIRKEISVFDILLEEKEDIIKALDKRFISVYKFLNVLTEKYSYLADTHAEHKQFYNKYKTYIQIVNSFNKEYLQYPHNIDRKYRL